ncbi:MAG: hypothetical protein WC783_04365 [Candidatus Paceibacterota bacterium]|jgi:hypothetical protein
MSSRVFTCDSCNIGMLLDDKTPTPVFCHKCAARIEKEKREKAAIDAIAKDATAIYSALNAQIFLTRELIDILIKNSMDKYQKEVYLEKLDKKVFEILTNKGKI